MNKIHFTAGTGTTATTVFDPSTNTFSAGTGLTSTAIGQWSNAFTILEGTNAGTRVILFDGTTNIVNFINPNTLGVTSTTLPGNGNNTGSMLTMSSPYTYSIWQGNGGTNLFNLNPTTLTTNTIVGQNLGVSPVGAVAIPILAGSNAGRYVIVHGNNTNSSTIFNPVTQTVIGPGPTLASAPNINVPSSFAIPLTQAQGANKNRVLLFKNSNATSNSNFLELYDPIANSFSTAGRLPITAVSPGEVKVLPIGSGVSFLTVSGLRSFFFHYQ